MSQIMDTVKHISVTGRVTISGICTRTDNNDAVLQGNDVCDRVQQICADKGCIFDDHRDTLLTRSGDAIEELLLIDGLHLSSAGTKKLLQNLKLSSMTSYKLDAKRNHWHDEQSNQQEKSVIRNAEITQQPRKQPMYGGQHAGDLRRTHPGQRREFSSSDQNKNNYPTAPKYAGAYSNTVRPNERYFGEQSNYRYCQWCGEANHDASRCRHKKPLRCFNCNHNGQK